MVGRRVFIAGVLRNSPEAMILWLQHPQSAADLLEAGHAARAGVARGPTHMVLIHADGIEWRGQRYRSLSLVARKITGARWSGPRFFGLRQRPLGSTLTARTGHGAGDHARAGYARFLRIERTC